MPTCVARPLLGTSGFLPSTGIARIAPRTRDPKTPQVDGGDGEGGSHEDEEGVKDRSIASESSSDEADDEGRQ